MVLKKIAMLTGLSLIVAGCQTGRDTPSGDDPDALFSAPNSYVTTKDDAGLAEPVSDSEVSADVTTKTIEIPENNVVDVQLGSKSETKISLPRSNEKIDVTTTLMSVSEFIDYGFGQLLDVPYSVGEGISQRNEKLRLTTEGQIKRNDLYRQIGLILKPLQIHVVPTAGTYYIVSEAELKQKQPIIIPPGGSLDELDDANSVIKFVNLDARSANEIDSVLRQIYTKDDLVIQPIQSSDTLILKGLLRDIEAASSLIDLLDTLEYAGTSARRISPRYWPAGELARELTRLLSAEGWQTSTNEMLQRSILIIPVSYSNDIFLFSRSEQGLQRAVYWFNELDRPARKGNEAQINVYAVQNVDAKLLADTVGRVVSNAGGSYSPDRQDASSNPPAVGDGFQTSASLPVGNLVVDPLSNQLIFTGTPSQYEQLLPLLERLDTPPAEVDIEVTVAEITLNDDTRYGVDFFIDSLGSSDVGVTVNAQGLGLGSAGNNIALISGNVDAAINFFASNNVVDVLSTPRVVARSGGSAQIQVGQEVPIITSQRAADAQSGGGTTDILQSVDYRSTGVLLTIEPIVYGSDRVDLSITQEVSTAISTTTSEIASPTISNRSLSTQLSLENGQTAVMGGLIQKSVTRDQKGTPLLKDLPLVGPVFRSTTLTKGRTELIILIRANVLRSQNDKSDLTEELVKNFNRALTNSKQLETYRGEQ